MILQGGIDPAIPRAPCLYQFGASRDLLAESSVMGIVATEQFSHFPDEEVQSVYNFLRDIWNMDRAMEEEAKIASL
jgi:hypothetical protein